MKIRKTVLITKHVLLFITNMTSSSVCVTYMVLQVCLSVRTLNWFAINKKKLHLESFRILICFLCDIRCQRGECIVHFSIRRKLKVYVSNVTLLSTCIAFSLFPDLWCDVLQLQNLPAKKTY